MFVLFVNQKKELSFLTRPQIDLKSMVFLSSNESLPYLVAICLSTGARWSEAENLVLSNCQNGGFQFVDTKNGKNRFVPVSEHWFRYVRARLRQGPFKPCYAAYRSAFRRSGLTVPAGQLAHVLRHTFASQFVMDGGNIVVLQRILGHSSLNVTMRYAHLSPDYLVQAITFNPLVGFEASWKESGN